jgi:hypothetical protein
VTREVFRSRLLAAWWSLTCSLVALWFDRRMTTGLAEELVDCTDQYSRELIRFREDVAISRFGSRWAVEDKR